MTQGASTPDTAGLRARAAGLIEVAGSAERAAARFAARSLAGIRDPEAEVISDALRRLAHAYRTASDALGAYAGELEDAAQRRIALDQLVAAAREAPTTSRGVVAEVQLLRDELVARLDRELGAAASRCTEALRSATPPASTAGEIGGAIVLAIGHARARLLELAGPDPGLDTAAPGLRA